MSKSRSASIHRAQRAGLAPAIEPDARRRRARNDPDAACYLQLDPPTSDRIAFTPTQRSNSMSTRGTPNRLAAETSPYLLQHAHNPVDWYPWGREALDRAKAEDKPIFLSVGYSA